MRGISAFRFPLLLTAALVFAAAGLAGQPVVSTMRNVNAVMQAGGYFISPAYDRSGQTYPGDLAPVQAFEIIRPRGEKIKIGRLYTSCSCVRLETSQTTFEQGERAVFELRNVIATPPQGQRYALYIQITSPIRTTLRYDTTVQSSQFIPQPAIDVSGPAKSGEGPEVIVPKADTEDKADTGDKAAGEERIAPGDKAAEAVADDSQTEEKADEKTEEAVEEKADAADGAVGPEDKAEEQAGEDGIAIIEETAPGVDQGRGDDDGETLDDDGGDDAAEIRNDVAEEENTGAAGAEGASGDPGKKE